MPSAASPMRMWPIRWRCTRSSSARRAAIRSPPTSSSSKRRKKSWSWPDIMIRVAIAGVDAGPLLVNPNRGQLFDVVDPSECDYLFTTERTIGGDPRRTFVLDTGDVLGALFDGATETRSTMSLLDGPIFLVSAPFA